MKHKKENNQTPTMKKVIKRHKTQLKEPGRKKGQKEAMEIVRQSRKEIKR